MAAGEGRGRARAGRTGQKERTRQGLGRGQKGSRQRRISPPDMRGMGPNMKSWHLSYVVKSIRPRLMIAPAPP